MRVLSCYCALSRAPRGRWRNQFGFESVTVPLAALARSRSSSTRIEPRTKSSSVSRCSASTVSFALPQPRLRIASAAVILADQGHLASSSAFSSVLSALSVRSFAA
jgi:hypothetical protein